MPNGGQAPQHHLKNNISYNSHKERCNRCIIKYSCELNLTDFTPGTCLFASIRVAVLIVKFPVLGNVVSRHMVNVYDVSVESATEISCSRVGRTRRILNVCKFL